MGEKTPVDSLKLMGLIFKYKHVCSFYV